MPEQQSDQEAISQIAGDELADGADNLVLHSMPRMMQIGILKSNTALLRARLMRLSLVAFLRRNAVAIPATLRDLVESSTPLGSLQDKMVREAEPGKGPALGSLLSGDNVKELLKHLAQKFLPGGSDDSAKDKLRSGEIDKLGTARQVTWNIAKGGASAFGAFYFIGQAFTLAMVPVAGPVLVVFSLISAVKSFPSTLVSAGQDLTGMLHSDRYTRDASMLAGEGTARTSAYTFDSFSGAIASTLASSTSHSPDTKEGPTPPKAPSSLGSP